MKYLLLTVMLFTFQSYVEITEGEHDVAVAVFHFTQVDGHVHLDVTFDIEDFMSSSNLSKNEVGVRNIERYLKSNIQIKLNQDLAILKVGKVERAGDHVKISAKLQTEVVLIKEVDIYNVCLYDITGHSNVIQFDINNQSKDYRMHRQRTKIKVTY